MLERCVGVNAASAAVLNRTGAHIFPTTFPPQCGAAACAPLADFEWLALDSQWTTNTSVGSRIYAKAKAVLKKSTAVSSALPTSMKLTVGRGAPCILSSLTKFSNYWLCVHHHHWN